MSELELTALEYAQRIGRQYGLDLTDEQANHMLWEETGFPGFFPGKPLPSLTWQLHAACVRAAEA